MNGKKTKTNKHAHTPPLFPFLGPLRTHARHFSWRRVASAVNTEWMKMYGSLLRKRPRVRSMQDAVGKVARFASFASASSSSSSSSSLLLPRWTASHTKNGRRMRSVFPQSRAQLHHFTAPRWADLVLSRHGESEGNVARQRSIEGDDSLFHGEFQHRHSSSWRLTDRGRRQAAAAGDWLRKNNLVRSPSRVYLCVSFSLCV